MLCQKMSLPCCTPPDQSWMLLIKNCGSWHRAITQEQPVLHCDFNSIQVEPRVGRWEGETFPVDTLRDKLTDLFGFIIHCWTHPRFTSDNFTVMALKCCRFSFHEAHRLLAECRDCCHLRTAFPTKKICPAACYKHLSLKSFKEHFACERNVRAFRFWPLHSFLSRIGSLIRCCTLHTE